MMRILGGLGIRKAKHYCVSDWGCSSCTVSMKRGVGAVALLLQGLETEQPESHGSHSKVSLCCLKQIGPAFCCC